MARHMETEGMCDMEEVEGGVVRKSRRVSWVREELTVFSWVREKLTEALVSARVFGCENSSCGQVCEVPIEQQAQRAAGRRLARVSGEEMKAVVLGAGLECREREVSGVLNARDKGLSPEPSAH
eukprot:131798-Rhodomonas_salina.1